MTIANDISALREVVTGALDPDSTDNFDYRLVRLALPPAHAMARLYFRAEVHGLDQVPDGPAMLVGNHNAGITFLEPFMMADMWYRLHGERDPLFFLAHDAMLKLPVLRNVLIKFGCVRASKENSMKIFDAGRKLVVFPGGNYEAFRKFSDRNTVDFGGHKGFARLAVKTDVPVVPMLSIGGHETFFVLWRGERLAKLTRADKILRSRSFPVALALPWGVMFGPFFHLPLPAKCTVEFGEPFRPSEITRNDSTDEKIDAVYDEAVGRIQSIMDEQASGRCPIIG